MPLNKETESKTNHHVWLQVVKDWLYQYKLFQNYSKVEKIFRLRISATFGTGIFILFHIRNHDFISFVVEVCAGFVMLSKHGEDYSGMKDFRAKSDSLHTMLNFASYKIRVGFIIIKFIVILLQIYDGWKIKDLSSSSSSLTSRRVDSTDIIHSSCLFISLFSPSL